MASFDLASSASASWFMCSSLMPFASSPIRRSMSCMRDFMRATWARSSFFACSVGAFRYWSRTAARSRRRAARSFAACRRSSARWRLKNSSR